MIRRTLVLLLLSGLLPAQPGLDPGGDLRLQTSPAILGGSLDLRLSGQPGANWILALDLLPGSLVVPGFGTIWLAQTQFLMFPLDSFGIGMPPLGATGELSLPIPFGPNPALDGFRFYAQVIGTEPLNGGRFVPSNAKSVELGLPGSVHPALGVMNEPHTFHRTLGLPNGSYLVIGGGSGQLLLPVASPNCERYNPYLRTFVADTPMSTERTLHTATSLPDGRILVTGGCVTLGAGLASTELYDPASQVWTPGPLLQSNRVAHSATLLDDGRILIAGGTSDFQANPPGSSNFGPIFLNALDTAQIYDPVTGTLSATANVMHDKRLGHAALRLPDGKVLISGGVKGGQTIFGVVAPLYATTADVFDPVTNQFTQVPGLAIPRMVHTMDLMPDGRVLAVGGAGSAFVVTTGTTEIFDPAAGMWSPGPALPGSQTLGIHASVPLPDGSIAIFGGAAGALGNLTGVGSVYRWSQALGWQTLAALPGARQALTATFTPEGVLLVGGGDAGDPGANPPIPAVVLDTAEIWTPLP